MASSKLSIKIIGTIIIISFIGLAILLAAELYFRINKKYSRASFQYDAELVYRLKKKINTKKAYAMGRGAHGKTFSLELNKHGFRGATPSIKKSAGTTRIMVIGDSYTAGLDYPDEEIFTQMLESRLNVKNQNYEVINVSCPSWATDQHYLYWTTEGLKYNPDILILMASPNDIRETYNKKIFQLQSDNSLKQNKVWMHWKERTGWWLARHSSLFQYIQKEFLDKKFGTFTNIYKYYPVHYFQEDYKDWDRPIFLKEPFKEVRESYILHEKIIIKLKEACQESSIKFGYAMIPIKNEFNGKYDNELTEAGRVAKFSSALAKRHQLPYLDLYSALSLTENPLDIYFDWEYHFDKEGHAFISDQLVNFVGVIENNYVSIQSSITNSENNQASLPSQDSKINLSTTHDPSEILLLKSELINSVWSYEVTTDCKNYYQFMYDSLIIYDCEIPEKLFGTYTLEGKEIKIQTVRSEFDKEFDKGSRHRHQPKSIKLTLINEDILVDAWGNKYQKN